jgi:hypothetical protein
VKKDKAKVLSLCIPTNGMLEWVAPLLESIYCQGIDDSLFEVVITDNGTNESFFDEINRFVRNHDNIIYKKTDVLLFQNQIECFRLATGEFVKFLNHRDILLNNCISKLIDVVKTYRAEKPIVYFLNEQRKIRCNDIMISFDTFMNELSYYSTWSGGFSFWKSDKNELLSLNAYDNYFPHIDVLLFYKNKRKYIIINDKLSFQNEVDDTKKGKYDLFDAFANHYVYILRQIYNNNYICRNTFIHIKNDNLLFVLRLHYMYIVKKKACSYILDSFWVSFLEQYSCTDFILGYVVLFTNVILSKIGQITKL